MAVSGVPDRPVTTLFLLASADGKISTGATDSMDFDRDLPHIDGVKEGLHQYYAIEQTTDLWSLNSGRVGQKIGANEKPLPPATPVSFAVVDNRHLNGHGVRYFCAKAKQLVLITANAGHPAYGVRADNLHILYQPRPDLGAALTALKRDFGCDSITVQTGGTLNGRLLREKLIDYVDVVVAPLLVGGRDTPTLIDGDAVTRPDGLDGLAAMELMSCEALEHSYVRLRYRVRR